MPLSSHAGRRVWPRAWHFDDLLAWSTASDEMSVYLRVLVMDAWKLVVSVEAALDHVRHDLRIL